MKPSKFISSPSLRMISTILPLVFVAGIASAQSERLLYDPTITILLDETSVGESRAGQKSDGSPKEAEAKAGCVAATNRAIGDLEREFKRNQDRKRTYRSESEIDLEYTCKSFVIWGTPAVTSNQESTQRSAVTYLLFFNPSTTTTTTITYGAKLFLGCEQRSFEEKALYSMTKRCEAQPTEACFNEKFLDRVRTLGPTRFIRAVNPNDICGIGQQVQTSSPSSRRPRTQTHEYQ